MNQTDWVGSTATSVFHVVPCDVVISRRGQRIGCKHLTIQMFQLIVAILPSTIGTSSLDCVEAGQTWRFKESSTRQLRARRTSSNNEVPKLRAKIGDESRKFRNQNQQSSIIATAADADCKERNKFVTIAYHAVATDVTYVEQYNVALNHLEFLQQLSNFLIMPRNICWK